jgi:hypothetical protein
VRGAGLLRERQYINAGCVCMWDAVFWLCTQWGEMPLESLSRPGRSRAYCCHAKRSNSAAVLSKCVRHILENLQIGHWDVTGCVMLHMSTLD